MSLEPDAAAYPHAAQLASLQRQSTHKRSGQTQKGTRYFVTTRGFQAVPANYRPTLDDLLVGFPDVRADAR